MSRDIVRRVFCCIVCISVLRFTFGVVGVLTEVNEPAHSLSTFALGVVRRT